MSWGSVIGAGIGAMTGRRDNKQAAKAARREQDWEQEFAEQANTWNREMQNSAQAFEAQQASSAMQFSHQEAQNQMNFQAMLNATAHQREANDLEAAGLNRILSGTGGMGAPVTAGASGSGFAGHSSGGSSAKGNAPKQTVFPTSGAIVSGAAMGAQVEKMLAEKDLLEAQAGEVRARTPTYETEIDYKKALTATEKERPSMVKAQVADYIEKAALNEATRSKIPLERDKLVTEISELWSRMVTQAAQAQNYRASSALMSEQTAGYETTRFVRKKITDLEQGDVGGYMKDVPIDLIKGVLLTLLPRQVQ